MTLRLAAAKAAPAIGNITAIPFAARAIPAINKEAFPASELTNSVVPLTNFVSCLTPSKTAGFNKSPKALDKFSVSLLKFLNTCC